MTIMLLKIDKKGEVDQQQLLFGETRSFESLTKSRKAEVRTHDFVEIYQDFIETSQDM